MKYLFKNISICSLIFLGGLLLSFPVQAQMSNQAAKLFNRGLQKTRKQDFKGAIADLQQSANLFKQQGNQANAYKSRALVIYLQQAEKNRQSRVSVGPNEDWYVFGQCLGEPICKYTINFITPEARITGFGGLLILEKSIGRFNLANGGSASINAVIDVQVVPKLRNGEWVMYPCEYNKQQLPEIIGLATIKGYEASDLYTQVRRAWRTNVNTETIEVISTKNVACINPCPGDC